MASCRVLVLAGATGLAGCAEYWAMPGGTPVQFGAMRETCARQAEAEFPPQMFAVATSTGNPAPFATRCAPVGGSVACSTTGVGFGSPAATTLDQTIGAREQALRTCLIAAGWQPVRSEAQAEAITRSAQ